MTTVATTPSVTNTNTTNTGTGDTAAASSKLDADFNTFLNLLTVQLKNQDPTQPLDTNQLTSQIAQLSQVEQQINTNKGINQLIAAQQAGAVNSAVSYIDRFVQFDSSNFYQRSGGSPILDYKLPTEAAQVTVSVTDTNGKVLYTQDMTSTGGTTAGTDHAVTWDGKDLDGNVMPTGKYKLNVNATDNQGNPITAETKVTDIVTEVGVLNGEVQLTMGNVTIPASQVISIKGTYAQVDPNATLPPSTDDGTDDGSTPTT